MKNYLKNKLQQSIRWIVKKTSVSLVCTYVYEQLIEAMMQQVRVVNHRSCTMAFAAPNLLCLWRIRTFSTKEPDTLAWIDGIPEESVLWDIGANIGTFSIYAAMARKCTVFSFEPSVFNLELLARNIYLNNLQDRITIFPIALNDALGANAFRLSSTSLGGALSSFAHNVDANGGELVNIFEYRTIGMTMDDAVELIKIPLPNYVKIDVDGIEHLILSGGENVLSQVDGLLIELPGVWKQQTEVAEKYLRNAGLKLISGHNYDPVLNPNVSANQIWAR